MADVSWYAKYNIHIENVDESVAFHLSKAIKAYMSKMNDGDSEIITSFEQIMDVCDTITRVDEEN